MHAPASSPSPRSLAFGAITKVLPYSFGSLFHCSAVAVVAITLSFSLCFGLGLGLGGIAATPAHAELGIAVKPVQAAETAEPSAAVAANANATAATTTNESANVATSDAQQPQAVSDKVATAEDLVAAAEANAAANAASAAHTANTTNTATTNSDSSEKLGSSNNSFSRVLGAQNKNSSSLSDSGLNSTEGIIKWLFSTIAVLGVIFLLAYMLKRSRFVQRSVGVMQVESQIALGPKERVVQIKVGERHLLLGVTNSSINFLADLDQLQASAPVAATSAVAPAAAAASTPAQAATVTTTATPAPTTIDPTIDPTRPFVEDDYDDYREPRRRAYDRYERDYDRDYDYSYERDREMRRRRAPRSKPPRRPRYQYDYDYERDYADDYDYDRDAESRNLRGRERGYERDRDYDYADREVREARDSRDPRDVRDLRDMRDFRDVERMQRIATDDYADGNQPQNVDGGEAAARTDAYDKMSAPEIEAQAPESETYTKEQTDAATATAAAVAASTEDALGRVEPKLQVIPPVDRNDEDLEQEPDFAAPIQQPLPIPAAAEPASAPAPAPVQGGFGSGKVMTPPDDEVLRARAARAKRDMQQLPREGDPDFDDFLASAYGDLQGHKTALNRSERRARKRNKR